MTAELEAFERWARGCGCWADDSHSFREHGLGFDGGVRLSPGLRAVDVHIWPPGQGRRPAKKWTLDPLTALLWANAVGSEVMVDVGSCSACAGERHQHWGEAPDQTDAPAWQSLKTWVPGVGAGWQSSRRCESCRPDIDDFPGRGYWLLAPSTGRERKPLALLVCEAAPQRECNEHHVSALGTDNVLRPQGSQGAHGLHVGCPVHAPEAWRPDRCPSSRCGLGDSQAREALTVASDRLLWQGEQLGEWIAAWLRGPCQVCDGQCSICDHTSGHMEGYGCSDCMNTGHLCASPCETCQGHGELVGAHADAMATALVRSVRYEWKWCDTAAESVTARRVGWEVGDCRVKLRCGAIVRPMSRSQPSAS